MAPDLDAERIDEAATDPPVRWVAVSLLGLGLVVVGLAAVVLGLVGLSGAVVAGVPVLGVVFDLSAFWLVVGLALFVLSMTEWEKELDE